MVLDYIIIGQGLAGSVLDLTMLKKGKKILVINRTDPGSSSLVAAGIYNPITGKVMKKTWMADVLFPFLEVFYSECEQTLGVQFLHKRAVYRPFLSVQEQNDWMAKSGEPGYDVYIKKICTEPTFPEFVRDTYGGIELQSCGYLDIPTFVQACRNYLERQGSYVEENFDENNLKIKSDRVDYKDWTAKKIIYCNGFVAQQSKFFSFLPFSPVKGELLVLKVRKDFERIFNRGVFMLPIGNNICKVGATYNWRDLSPNPTEEAKNELLEKLNKLSNLTFEIENQIVGTRPATRDRRPFLGLHPKLEPLGIFNGLGTKGVSLAPYFADQLVNYLEGMSDLANEVSINRYF